MRFVSFLPASIPEDVHLAAFSALCPVAQTRGLSHGQGKHSISKSFCLPCLMLLPGDKWTNLQFMSRCSVWISIQVFLAGKWQGQAEHNKVIPWSFCFRFVRESWFENSCLNLFIRRIFSRMLKTSSQVWIYLPCSQTPGRSKWSSQR